MTSLKMTQTTARELALFAQGLYRPLSHPAEKADLISAVTHLGAVQIDTINIVARNAYFSMWSRLGNYDKAWLDQLLEEKTTFEYWAHAASILPIEDYPLHRRFMLERNRLQWFTSWYESHKEETIAILEYIKDHGEVRSVDFEHKESQPKTWWNWKTEKRALEYWFASGELMVSRRVNFQRVYDLRERVLPDWEDNNAPDMTTTLHRFLLKSITAMGLALPGWMGDYYRLSKTDTQSTLSALIEENKLLPVEVEGWSETGWVCPEVWESFQQESQNYPSPQLTTILAPFDSLIWDRKRTRQLFGFEYSIEFYLPAEKRHYGYFVLPILHNTELIGRVDVKAHRAEKKFEIKALYLEDRIKPTKTLAKSIADALIRCAAWHNTPEVILGKCEPDSFRQMLLINL